MCSYLFLHPGGMSKRSPCSEDFRMIHASQDDQRGHPWHSGAGVDRARRREAVQMDRVEVRIVNRLQEIPKIADMVEQFGAEHGVPGPVINDLNIALDEVLSNIVSYAYDAAKQGEI